MEMADSAIKLMMYNTFTQMIGIRFNKLMAVMITIALIQIATILS